ncbi:hypothetical protein M6B38_171875 [Iris pallida]|uniref:Uncharacterized protein n=1 Tax=Iris pallida TaxID=29817 RepID=A0AAX6EUW4_IRIPA|nr:hypothetical protein M6B38_171875 [Iris pallida]
MPHEPRLRSCKTGSITADYSGCDGIVAQKSRAETLNNSSENLEQNTSYSKMLFIDIETRITMGCKTKITSHSSSLFSHYKSLSSLSSLNTSLAPADALEGDAHTLCPV